MPLCHTGDVTSDVKNEAGPSHGALPPLVEPAPTLSQEEVSRYSRHLLISDVGEIGQRRLKNARVLVMGAGGLGSPILLYLAAAGVGTIGIVDHDVVDVTNLQRQVIHGTTDIGRDKTASAAESIAAVNPHVTVNIHDVTVTAANALDVFAPYDLILDGTDNFATRYLVNDACAILNKPYVWGSILRFEGQVAVFWATQGPQYRDLYPVPPPPGSVPSCAEGGVFGVLCATIGATMATEALKLICGIGEPLLGRVLIYDALAMSFRTVPLAVDPQRKPITELIDYDVFCGVLQPAELQRAQELAWSPQQLQQQLAGPIPPVLIDVRSDGERDIVALDGAHYVPLADVISGRGLSDFSPDRTIVVLCRTGRRSAQAVLAMQDNGYIHAHHLAGGIVHWVQEVAPWLATY